MGIDDSGDGFAGAELDPSGTSRGVGADVHAVDTDRPGNGVGSYRDDRDGHLRDRDVSGVGERLFVGVGELSAAELIATEECGCDIAALDFSGGCPGNFIGEVDDVRYFEVG